MRRGRGSKCGKDVDRDAPISQTATLRFGPARKDVHAGVGRNADALAAKSKDVRHHIKSIIGVSCQVDVKAPGGIPRSEGKAVRVIDQR